MTFDEMVDEVCDFFKLEEDEEDPEEEDEGRRGRSRGSSSRGKSNSKTRNKLDDVKKQRERGRR